MNGWNFRRLEKGSSALVLLLAVSIWVDLSCSGDGRRQLERAPGSVLWVSSQRGAVEPTALAALAASGVTELFYEVAELSGEGDELLISRSWPEAPLPPRAVATLVISGVWAPSERDPELVGENLAQELRSLGLEAQSRGVIPKGFHFDLRCDTADLEGLAKMLAATARRLPPQSLLSATLDRNALAGPEAVELAAAVDFLVVFLYGQREGEVEDPKAWDLDAVVEGLRRVEGLGKDYLLGVVTLGQAVRAVQRGGSSGGTTEMSLRALLDTPSLESAFGFSLEGLDRQVYIFEARAATRLLGWDLRAEDRVRVTRLTAVHLRRLQERLDQLELEHHLGELYYRTPAPEEGLSLTVPALAASLSGFSLSPPVEGRLMAGERRGSGEVLRVQAYNPGFEGTDIARVGSNYLELRALRGSFQRVDVGGFARYDLLDRATGERTLRRPDLLRLYVPYLAAGEVVTSGPIVLAGGGSTDIQVGGQFLLAGGVSEPVVPSRGRRREGEGD